MRPTTVAEFADSRNSTRRSRQRSDDIVRGFIRTLLREIDPGLAEKICNAGQGKGELQNQSRPTVIVIAPGKREAALLQLPLSDLQ